MQAPLSCMWGDLAFTGPNPALGISLTHTAVWAYPLGPIAHNICCETFSFMRAHPAILSLRFCMSINGTGTRGGGWVASFPGRVGGKKVASGCVHPKSAK